MVGDGNGFVVLPVGNLLCDVRQLADGGDGLFHDAVAEYQDGQQSDNEQGDDDVAQAIEALHGVGIGTYQGQTPVGSRNGHIGNVVQLAVRMDVYGALFACCHFVSQCYQVHVFSGTGIGKDGFLEQPGGVGMYQITSVGTKQHVVGIGVGVFYLVQHLCHAVERQVGSHHAYDASVRLTERPAVGGDGLAVVDLSLDVIDERVYPAGSARGDGFGVAGFTEVVVLRLAVCCHCIAPVDGVEGITVAVLLEHVRYGKQ